MSAASLPSALLIASIVVLRTSLALAQAGEPSVDHPPSAPRFDKPRIVEEVETERRWYGAPMLGSDGIAVALLGSALAARSANYSAGAAISAAIVFGLSGPLTHAFNQRWGIAIASLAMRVLGTGAAGFLGVVVGLGVGGWGDYAGATAAIGGGIGILVGSAVASVIDSAVLAYKTQPVEASIAPNVAAVMSGENIVPTVGVSGRF